MKLLQQAKNNPFLSNAFLIFLARFFPSAANLLVIIYYSRHLDTVLYGTYSNFWINLNLLYPLACMGIHVLIFTYPAGFISKILGQIKVPQYAAYGLWLAVTGIAFAALQAPSLQSWVVPFCFVLVYAITLILESCVIVCKQARWLVLINVLFSIAYWLIHKNMISGASFSLQNLFTALLLLSLVRLLIYIVITFKNLKESNSSAQQVFDMQKVRSLWLYLALYDIIQNYSSWVDKFIVAHTLDSRSSGIYYNGSLNIPFLPLLLGAALNAVLIELSTSDKRDVSRMLQLVNHAGRVMACIVFPLFFFLLLYRYQVVVLLLSEKYVEAIPVFLASLLVMPLRAYGFTSLLQREHQGAIINKGALGEIIIGCLLVYPLYHVWGLPGVALSFVVSTYCQAVYYVYHTARILHVRWWQLLPVGNWLAKLGILTILFLAVYWLTTIYFTGLFAVILGGAFTLAVMLVTLLLEIKNTGGTNGTSHQTART